MEFAVQTENKLSIVIIFYLRIRMIRVLFRLTNANTLLS